MPGTKLTSASMIAVLFVGVVAAQDGGVEAFQRGDYAAAEKLLSADPSARGKAFLALTQAATGRCSEAEAELRTRQTQAQMRLLTGLTLVRCLIAAERWADASAALATLETEFPENPDVLYEAARLHLKAWNGAVARMFEGTPASFRVNQLSAEIFEIQGRYDEAVAEYRKALTKSPRSLNLHYRLGRALLARSHEPAALEEARKEFAAELELNPYDAVAHYQIAQILDVQQKSDEAAKSLEEAVRLDPDFPEALTALARYRSRAGEHASAVKLLERAVELQPKAESSLYALMVAYRNAGRRDEALAAKKRLDALQQSPEGEFSDFLRRIGEQPQP